MPLFIKGHAMSSCDNARLRSQLPYIRAYHHVPLAVFSLCLLYAEQEHGFDPNKQTEKVQMTKLQTCSWCCAYKNANVSCPRYINWDPSTQTIHYYLKI